MNSLFSTLISAIKARLIKIWNLFRVWTNPTVLKARIIGQIRVFFIKLFDIKPRNKKDYYTISSWMISKKLAFAIVVVIGVLSLWYIYCMKPLGGFAKKTASIKTYRYNSIPLKFHQGDVRILAKDKHVAYVGNVEKGVVEGNGKLYNRNKKMIYEGMFQNNQYEGSGKQYYETGELKYEGEFSNNLFHGKGRFYRKTGTLEYEGGYLNGYRSGEGQLYNTNGTLIYQGKFSKDQIVYSELVGKTTQEVKQQYGGEVIAYQADEEYCTKMKDIHAFYTAESGEDTLEADWKVKSVLVQESQFAIGNQVLKTIGELENYFGRPTYYGNTNLLLPEVLAWNDFASTNPESFSEIDVEQEQILNNAYKIQNYDKTKQVYIYTFESEDLLYTFYCNDQEGRFFMFSIEQA